MKQLLSVHNDKYKMVEGIRTMRRAILCLFILFIFTITSSVHERANSMKLYEMIPEEAIRLRILANSDTETDQRIKLLVRDRVRDYITELVHEIDHIENARNMIEDHLPELEAIVRTTLHEEGVAMTYSVEYGRDILFPDKVYGNLFYPAGSYEAVLVTLGAGEGTNWWCVLFPPLCFIDFSNEETVAQAEEAEFEDEEHEEVEVKFFLLEWLGLS